MGPGWLRNRNCRSRVGADDAQVAWLRGWWLVDRRLESRIANGECRRASCRHNILRRRHVSVHPFTSLPDTGRSLGVIRRNSQVPPSVPRRRFARLLGDTRIRPRCHQPHERPTHHSLCAHIEPTLHVSADIAGGGAQAGRCRGYRRPVCVFLRAHFGRHCATHEGNESPIGFSRLTNT